MNAPAPADIFIREPGAMELARELAERAAAFENAALDIELQAEALRNRLARQQRAYWARRDLGMGL